MILEINSQCRSLEFQKYLTNFQILTGDVVKGSNYEIEIYKLRLRELEEHCSKLEKNVEFVFLNKNFYDEMVEDLIDFKSLSEVCSDIGGYYDACKY